MKRFLMSTAAAGVALSMIGAPLAMAQDQHPQGGEHTAPHSDQVHATGPQHPIEHTTVQHTAVNHNQPVHTVPHQMTQVSHEQQHPAPMPVHHDAPPVHQVAYSGHQWHHGDHDTGNRTYITNYNSYHLSAPPSGYQWVQDGSQFVLIAVASGIIANVILNAAVQ